MKVLNCLAFIFLLLLSSCSKEAKDFTRFLDDLRKAPFEHGIKSPFQGNILIAQNGEILHQASVGSANQLTDTDNQQETLFPIASVSKQFTSMMVLQLYDQGVLDIYQPISNYMEVPADKAKITIYQLMTHSSGLPHYSGLMELGIKEDFLKREQASLQKMAALSLNTRLIYTPGEKAAYSSLGYYLLGAILEEVSTTKIDQLLDSLICQPLALENTGYYDQKTDLAKPYRFNKNKGFKKFLDKEGGQITDGNPIGFNYRYSAGGMFSTIGDLYQWSEAIRTNKLLSEKSFTIMTKANTNGFACGWLKNWPDLLERNTTAKGILHSGAIPGYRSSVGIFDNGLTILFLANIFPVDDANLHNKLFEYATKNKSPYKEFPYLSNYRKYTSSGGDEGFQSYFQELSALSGYEILPSKRSINRLMSIYLEHGEPRKVDSLQNVLFEKYVLFEDDINELGYALGGAGLIKRALKIHQLNANQYPASPNVWDSLGDSFKLNKNYAKALDSYQKAYQLGLEQKDPNLKNYQRNVHVMDSILQSKQME